MFSHPKLKFLLVCPWFLPGLLEMLTISSNTPWQPLTRVIMQDKGESREERIPVNITAFNLMADSRKINRSLSAMAIIAECVSMCCIL